LMVSERNAYFLGEDMKILERPNQVCIRWPWE
jgi:hypothetical protein